MECLLLCGLLVIPASGTSLAQVVAAGSSGRASDADRDEAFAALATAFEHGQLTQEEYERRLDRAGDATWRAEIRACTADLDAG